MKIIAVMNQKGGIGKTMTAAAIAYIMGEEKGKKKNQTTLQVEEWLKTQSGHDCFATAIRRSIIAEKSTVAQVPLPKFSKNCIVTQDYRAATYELMKEV